MLFDETSPTIKYFQKPIFGKKTMLKNPDGSRTGASTALTATTSWLSGLSPLGSEAGRSIDNLIQGGASPKYLADQEWYQNNVDQAQGKADAIGSAVGGAADSVRGIAGQVVGMLTGTGAAAGIATGAATKTGGGVIPSPKTQTIKELSPIGQMSPTDPSVKFNQMLRNPKFQALTTDQRIQQDQRAKKQMQYLPQFDENDASFGLYSDTPALSKGMAGTLRKFR